MSYTPSDDTNGCPEFVEWYAKNHAFHGLANDTLNLMRKAFMEGMKHVSLSPEPAQALDPQTVREISRNVERAVFEHLNKMSPRAQAIERMLVEPHAWHQQPKTLCARTSKGDLMEWDGAEAYSDSKLCEETINALKK